LPHNTAIIDVVVVIAFLVIIHAYCNVKVGVSKPTRELVGRLTELGWLYQRIKKYIDESLGQKSLGLVHQVSSFPVLSRGISLTTNFFQSLCAALQQELTDYYRLIAVLETQINQLQQQPSSLAITTASVSQSPAPTMTLTLRRLAVWIQDPLQRLKIMAIVVDAVKGK
jgi:gamma-tubulin complex component 3